MNIYEKHEIADLLNNNAYAGRGIIVGKTPDGSKAVAAYFIMGRSANSRNRIFAEKDGAVFTQPFDVSKVEDPSLIIYAAVRRYGNKLIVTNGDQTDTVYEGLKEGKCFFKSLKTRCFEPDTPNFTPRISAMLTFENGDFGYSMSILKSADEDGNACARYLFEYPSVAGTGHFLHTYMCDGNPLPSFCGEPERIKVKNDIDEFTSDIWNSLNADNKISLYVSYVDLKSGAAENRIINKNGADK